MKGQEYIFMKFATDKKDKTRRRRQLININELINIKKLKKREGKREKEWETEREKEREKKEREKEREKGEYRQDSQNDLMMANLRR